MAAERIDKYFDDAKALLGAGNTGKILSEAAKLSQYLQKHQNEIVPDGAKTKLVGTIELYYKFTEKNGSAEVAEGVLSLMGTYLQLPEGRMLGSKDKKRVLVWYTALEHRDQPSNSSSSRGFQQNPITKWIITDINSDGSLQLMNFDNNDAWKESYVASNIGEYLSKIRELNDADGAVIEIDEALNRIVSVSANS